MQPLYLICAGWYSILQKAAKGGRVGCVAADQDGAEAVQFDFEWKVLEQGIAEDFSPFHEDSSRVAWQI